VPRENLDILKSAGLVEFAAELGDLGLESLDAQKQAAFTRKVIARAKTGDKVAEEYLKMMLSSGLDR